MLEYELAAPQAVQLTVFSLLGQELIRLVDEWQPAGRHSVPLSTSNYANGVYVARLQSEEMMQTVRMVLVR